MKMMHRNATTILTVITLSGEKGLVPDAIGKRGGMTQGRKVLSEIRFRTTGGHP